jgi:hypothetical protein
MVMKALTVRKRDELTRLRRALELIAYISLAADIAISTVTLVYQNTHLQSLIGIELFLGDILAIIVAASLITLAAIAFFSIRKRRNR